MPMPSPLLDLPPLASTPPDYALGALMNHIGVVFIMAGLVIALLGHVIVTELRQQRRDVAVVAAVAPPTTDAVFRLVLFGGPCDGGSIVVSASVWRLMRADRPMMFSCGQYQLTGEALTPSGGAVLSYAWVAAQERAA